MRIGLRRPVPDDGRGVPERARPRKTCWRSTGRARARRSPSSPWPTASAASCGPPSPPQQVDIDVNHPQGKAYLLAILRTAGGGRRPHGALRRGGLRHQEARRQLLHDGRDLRLHRRVRRHRPRLGMEVLVEVHSLLPQADRDRAAGGLGVRLRAAAAGAACAVLRHCRAAEGLDPAAPRQRHHRARHARRHRHHRHRRRRRPTAPAARAWCRRPSSTSWWR
jgi:hypothetical protein